MVLPMNTDRVVSLSAMAVSVCTLVVILYQTHLTRQAQYASAMPYLMIGVTSNDRGVHVTLANLGLGPALLDSVRIRYKGQSIDNDPYGFFLQKRAEYAQFLSVDQVMPGRLISAGQTIQMVGTESAGHKEVMLRDILQSFEIAEVPKSWYEGAGATGTGKATIEITYSSVYGDRWRTRSDRIVPEEF